MELGVQQEKKKMEALRRRDEGRMWIRRTITGCWVCGARLQLLQSKLHSGSSHARCVSTFHQDFVQVLIVKVPVLQSKLQKSMTVEHSAVASSGSLECFKDCPTLHVFLQWTLLCIMEQGFSKRTTLRIVVCFWFLTRQSLLGTSAEPLILNGPPKLSLSNLSYGLRSWGGWCLQFHPDVNKDVDANDKFKSIRHAYEVRCSF